MNQILRRDLELEEAGIAADFFHREWRPNHIFSKNRQLLFWQFFDNPYASLFTRGLTFKVAFCDGEVAGVVGYIPFAFNCYGSKQYGCHVTNWWTAPAHRRGTVAFGLLRDLQYGMKFDTCIAGGITPLAEKLYEGLRWVLVRNLPRVVLPVDHAGFSRLLDPSGDGAWGEAARRAKSMGAEQETEPTDGTSISELASFDSLSGLGWDAFYWTKLAPSHMGPARETAYLVWRYQQIPIFKYRALIATNANGISGLLVFRMERVKEREEQIVRIVDLAAEPAAVKPLIGTLVEEARSQRALMIDFFSTKSAPLKMLSGSGFIDACSPAGDHYWCPFLFQPLDHQRDRLNCAWWIKGAELRTRLAPGDFYMTKGDNEFDRPN